MTQVRITTVTTPWHKVFSFSVLTLCVTKSPIWLSIYVTMSVDRVQKLEPWLDQRMRWSFRERSCASGDHELVSQLCRMQHIFILLLVHFISFQSRTEKMCRKNYVSLLAYVIVTVPKCWIMYYTAKWRSKLAMQHFFFTITVMLPPHQRNMR